MKHRRKRGSDPKRPKLHAAKKIDVIRREKLRREREQKEKNDN